MSDCEQDCYRNLLHRYFGIEDEKISHGEKTIDEILTNLHSALVSSGKCDEVSLNFFQYRNERQLENLFKYFWNLEEAHQNIDFDIIPSGKCRELSYMLMKDGSRFLKRKLYPQGLDLINLSILYAPHPALSDLDEFSVDESTSHSIDSASIHEEILNKNDKNNYSTTESTYTSLNQLLQENTNLDINHDVKQDINHDVNNDINHVNHDINDDINLDANHDVNHVVNQDVKHDDNHNDNQVDCHILGLSYTIRAKLLFELKQYEKCLLDIDRAIELSFESSIPLDLIDMKKKSLLALQTEQDKKLKQSLHAFEDIDFSEITEEESITKMKSLMNKFRNDKNHGYNNKIHVENMKDDDLLFSYDNPTPPELEEINPEIPSVSNALRLEYSPEKGRHMVAARDISPGEIVTVDKAYSWNVDILNPTATVTFCRTCLSRTAVPIPCPNCSKVVFCSDECRETGLSTVHEIECGIIPTMIEVGSCVLPRLFSLITQLPFIQLKRRIPELQKEVKENKRQYHGFNDNDVFDSTDYQTVYHMEGNFTKKSVSQLLHLCTVSFIVVKMLIESKRYFVDEAGFEIEPEESDIVLVGSVCLDHLCQVICNSAQIDEYQLKIDDIGSGHDVMKVGSGMFPAICLFNHSCNPSTMINSYGTTAVCHAVKFIPAGEDITYTYNMTYYNHELKERQNDLLEHYHFSCECEACLEDWKVKISGNKLSSRKLIKQIDEDPKTDIYNEKVKEIENVMNSIAEKFHSVVMDFKENKKEVHTHLDTIIDVLEFFEKYVELPNHIHFMAQRYLIYLNFGIEFSAYRYVM